MSADTDIAKLMVDFNDVIDTHELEEWMFNGGSIRIMNMLSGYLMFRARIQALIDECDNSKDDLPIDYALMNLEAILS